MFSPELSEIRFGCGLSPDLLAGESLQGLLQNTAGPDHMAAAYPIEGFDTQLPKLTAFNELRRKVRKARGTAAHDELKVQFDALHKEIRQARFHWFAQSILRYSRTTDGFRERLTLFWADHFTAQGKGGLLRHMGASYVESAIRPYLTGQFSDLLIAAVTHPLMLHYLDQTRSIGPGSIRAQKLQNRRGPVGLNENLAREVMELHTLGVDGPYSQQDVRQLAELFTGMIFSGKRGFQFRPKLAEPGSETILGTEYGSDPAQLEPIHKLLRDLAVHPATADHIARKLVVHFVGDSPNASLVDHVAERYRKTGGDLMQVYEALLEHPAAWDPELRNVKPPFDFVASTCRALGIRKPHLSRMKPRRINTLLLRPLTMMGQYWEHPNGPDGWPEDDTAWITPQGLAARIRWAMLAPQQLVKPLPKPDRFTETSLRGYANGRVHFAANAAETRAEGIGLVLSSPAFQRR